MATPFQGLSSASAIDPSTQKRFVVDRDNTQTFPVEDWAVLEIKEDTSITGAATLTNDIVGECVTFSGGAAGQSYQLPTALDILRIIQTRWGGQIATTYMDNTIVTSRFENQSAGAVTLTTNTGLTLNPSPIVISAGVYIIVEWIVRDSSPLTPAVEVRIRSGSSSGGGGILSVQPGLNITIDNTDPFNPIVNWVEFNYRSALDPTLTGVDDVATIQNTIDAVQALGGGLVVIPERGTPWLIDAPIDLTGYSDITIKGEKDTILERTADDYAFIIDNTNDISFESLNFMVSTGLFPSFPTITGTTAIDATITDCKFEVNGVEFVGSTRVIIEKNFFDYSDTEGVFLGSSGQCHIRENNFTTWGAQNTPVAIPSFGVATLDNWTIGANYNQGDLVYSNGALYWCSLGGGPAANPAPIGQSNNVVDGGGAEWVYMQLQGTPAIQLSGAIGLNDSNNIEDNFFAKTELGISGTSNNIIVDHNRFIANIQLMQVSNIGGGSFTQLDNQAITNNIASSLSMGFQLSDTGPAAPVEHGNWHINNNQFSDVTDSPFWTAPRMIEVSLSGGANSDLRNLMVNNNSVAGITNGDHMIHIFMDAGSYIFAIRCSDNSIHGNATAAISIVDGTGIGLVPRIVCNDNQVNLGGGFDAANIPAILNQIIYANNATA